MSERSSHRRQRRQKRSRSSSEEERRNPRSRKEKIRVISLDSESEEERGVGRGGDDDGRMSDTASSEDGRSTPEHDYEDRKEWILGDFLETEEILHDLGAVSMSVWSPIFLR